MVRRRTPGWAALLFLCCAVAAHAQTRDPRTAAANTPDIAFTVSMPEPHTHLLQVEMRVRAVSGDGRTAAAVARAA